MIRIKPYKAGLLNDWRQVLALSLNGTFMHSRSFMDYHGDRFDDASLLAYKNDLPIGIFPANRTGDRVYSHKGLTYGSLVVIPLGMADIISTLDAILGYYKSIGISKVVIKEIPSFYARSGTEGLAYAYHQLGGILFRTDFTLAVPLPSSKGNYSKNRRWRINQASRCGLEIREGAEFRSFWEELLVPNLWLQHRVKPVHQLEEMERIKENNKDNIQQFNVFHKGNLVAGATMFITENTAHAQYLASSSLGKKLNALSYLVHALITETFSQKSYFDFGTVNEQEGKKINKGLMEWKESFGARPFLHSYYRIDLDSYRPLEGIYLDKGRADNETPEN